MLLNSHHQQYPAPPTDDPITVDDSGRYLYCGDYYLDMIEAAGPMGPMWRVQEFAKRGPVTNPQQGKGRDVSQMSKSAQRMHGHQHGGDGIGKGQTAMANNTLSAQIQGLLG